MNVKIAMACTVYNRYSLKIIMTLPRLTRELKQIFGWGRAASKQAKRGGCVWILNEILWIHEQITRAYTHT